MSAGPTGVQCKLVYHVFSLFVHSLLFDSCKASFLDFLFYQTFINVFLLETFIHSFILNNLAEPKDVLISSHTFPEILFKSQPQRSYKNLRFLYPNAGSTTACEV